MAATDQSTSHINNKPGQRIKGYDDAGPYIVYHKIRQKAQGKKYDARRSKRNHPERSELQAVSKAREEKRLDMSILQ